MTASVTIHGNIVADTELRFTASGSPCAKFTVATRDRKKSPSGQWEDGPASFWNCTAWDKQAEACAENFLKGTLVLVEGKIGQRKYEAKDGTERTVHEVTVEFAGPSYRWGDGSARAATPSSPSSSGYDPPPF